jgi:flagellar biosynthesis protein FlhF
VKKFQAKDMAEAMKMVKTELGPDAIILHSRDTGKGLIGLFTGRGVEVTAAVDLKESRKEPAKSKPKLPQPGSAPAGNTFSSPSGNRIDIKIDGNGFPKGEDNPLLALSKQLEKDKQKTDIPPIPPSPSPSVTEPPKISLSEKRLENRLEHLENQLSKLTGMIANLVPSIASGELPSVPTHTRALYNHLLEQDVDESLALSIATQIAESTDDRDDVWTALKTFLLSKIPVAPPLELDLNAKRPKVLMLVGPTGVGKTTTLAKISAQYKFAPQSRIRPKIVFVTADLYRLAAVEQLQKYTEILGAELEVTYSPEEVRQSLNKHKEAHLILFDTAGASQRNMPQMTTLAAIAQAARPTELHLVLSSTTKYSDIVDIVEHFKEIEPVRLVFTKIDESTTFGTILNTVTKYKIPISYLTTGQNVPEDIEIARPERIAKLLLTKPVVNRSIESFNARKIEVHDEDDASKHTESASRKKEVSREMKGKQDQSDEAKNS